MEAFLILNGYELRLSDDGIAEMFEKLGTGEEGRERVTTRPAVAPPGLCASCAHAQVVRSSRGSEFSLCRLSLSDERFPRYPVLPVHACAGYRPTPKA